MDFVIGIDGGGTKTQGILCDSEGRVYASFRGGPSNHQFIPKEAVQENLRRVIEELLQLSGIDRRQVGFCFLGLSGADSEKDRQMLTELLLPVLAEIPYRVENDIWNAMASVPSVAWGAVAISGTGYNMAAVDKQGTAYTLRALEYEHGNLSTTDQLIREALHYAFRSEEHTGYWTVLETYIPELLQADGMPGVLAMMETAPEKVYKNGAIVREIFRGAKGGDRICQDILVRMGTSMGEMLGNFLNSTRLRGENIPVVLSGSIFTGPKYRLHIDAMALALRREVPDFHIIVSPNLPAAGACARALGGLGIHAAEEIVERIDHCCSGRAMHWLHGSEKRRNP